MKFEFQLNITKVNLLIEFIEINCLVHSSPVQLSKLLMAFTSIAFGTSGYIFGLSRILRVYESKGLPITCHFPSAGE